MKKKLIALTVVSLLVMAILAGCSGADSAGAKQNTAVSPSAGGVQASSSQSAPPAPSPAVQKLKKFNVGYLSTPGHVLYFVAQEKGYFKEEGLEVELFQFTNSGEGLNAIKAGKLDAGSFGTAAPLTFIAKGADFTVFGGQQTEGHALVAKPDNADAFKNLQNYKGKKIATVRLSTGDVVFRGALSEAGVDWKNDVAISELESPAAVLEAVKKGSADAGIVWTPYVEMAKSQGLQAVTYSGDLKTLHPCCRQVALTSSIKADPVSYEKFTAALIKAFKFYKSNQDDTVNIIAKYVQIDKALIKAETYGGHIFSIPDPNKAGVVDFWNYMNKIGYISSDLKIEDYINTDVYKNALEKLLTQNPGDEVYMQLKADFKQ